ncbi:hypothetical protein C8A00DRAFT_19105 [Chaetomidium leptoderma]|uniref:SRR1-like domain-containing protein n=1 Tax=Chaetomidium leptoderma TaxID=669021 RepID=A0AAN6VER5_9PEZI|nr:hypothetical protein C8A00DRAFT_19105 [Chaetomidium leptoderma]
MTAAHRLIQAKYDAEIPFFTKDSFRDVVRQFESDGNLDRLVSVTGLDGVAVHFPLETGREYLTPMYGDDYVCSFTSLIFSSTRTKPRLVYHPIERLLAAPGLSSYSVRRSYLPIEVAHSTEVRNARTNELVGLWPASDYAAVKQRFERATRSLAASKEFVQLKSTLASVAIPPGIDKIVAFACSTMTWAGNDITRSMAQHALALAVRDFLANSDITGADGEGASGIKCYAQDPIYTPVDERVLSEAGFTVVDDPKAFLEVDEASVIIAINPDISVRQIIADLARPAIMIWNKVTVNDRNMAVTDPVSLRVERMVEGYIELPFPAEDEFFGRNLAIYIRKRGPKENKTG